MGKSKEGEERSRGIWRLVLCGTSVGRFDEAAVWYMASKVSEEHSGTFLVFSLHF